MKINILLFAKLKDIFNQSSVELELPEEATVGEMLDRFISLKQELEEMRDFLKVSVNLEYANMDLRIQPGDEIAVIPPVSGG